MSLLRSRHHRAMVRLVEHGIPSRHGRPLWEVLDELAPAPRAVAILHLATNAIDGEGFSAAYTDLDVGAAELTWAAEHVGASAYADLFHRVQQVIPEDIRHNRRAVCTFVVDREELFEQFDAAYYALEDSGDILIEHMIRYTLHHADEFTRYSVPSRESGSG